MKREFLKNLGLEDEVINKIMAEHGTSTTALQTEVATLKDDIKVKDGVIEARNTKISELEKVDVEAIKTAEYERGKTEGSAEVEKFKFQNALDSKLKEFKAKDPKVFKSLLDETKIKYENGEIKGLDELVNPLKESHSYLFESDKILPTFTNPNPGNNKIETGMASLGEALKEKYQ